MSHRLCRASVTRSCAVAALQGAGSLSSTQCLHAAPQTCPFSFLSAVTLPGNVQGEHDQACWQQGQLLGAKSHGLPARDDLACLLSEL